MYSGKAFAIFRLIFMPLIIPVSHYDHRNGIYVGEQTRSVAMRQGVPCTISDDINGCQDVHDILRPLAEPSAVTRSCSEPSTSYSQSSNLIFEVSSSSERLPERPSIGSLLVRRPVAAVGLLPQPLVLFSAGACAGALGVTSTGSHDTTLYFHFHYAVHSPQMFL